MVLTFVMMMAVGSMTLLQAAVNEEAQLIRGRGVAERVTNRMAANLMLTEPQVMDVLQLNHSYYFLFDADMVLTMSDRHYRKEWNSYERKLRRILSPHQYTLYLSLRGNTFAEVARPMVGWPMRQGVTPPRGQQRPMAAAPAPRKNQRPNAQAPRGNNRQPNTQPPRGDNRQPNTQQPRPETNKPQAGPDDAGKPKAGQDKPNKPNVNNRRSVGSTSVKL